MSSEKLTELYTMMDPFTQIIEEGSFHKKYRLLPPLEGSNIRIPISDDIQLHKMEIPKPCSYSVDGCALFPGYMELCVCLEGSVRCDFKDKKTALLTKGSVMLMRDGDWASSYQIQVSHSCKMIGINVDLTALAGENLSGQSPLWENCKEDLQRLFHEKDYLIFSCNPTQLQQAFQLFNKKTSTVFDFFQLRQKTLDLFCVLVFDMRNTGQQDAHLAAEIMRRIQLHPSLSPFLYELEAEMGLSRYLLNKIFFQTYGHTIRTQIKRTRLETACYLLKNTSLSIIEISNRIGFENPSKFSQFFCKAQGITPGKYRKGE